VHNIYKTAVREPKKTQKSIGRTFLQSQAFSKNCFMVAGRALAVDVATPTVHSPLRVDRLSGTKWTTVLLKLEQPMQLRMSEILCVAIGPKINK
jgi:hypothetical protein